MLRHIDIQRKRKRSKYFPDSPLIKTNYLSDDPNRCEEIMVPLWTKKPDHWYLLVVLLKDSKGYLLDSLPNDNSSKTLDNASAQMRRLATIMSSSKTDERLQRFKAMLNWEIEKVKVQLQAKMVSIVGCM